MLKYLQLILGLFLLSISGLVFYQWFETRSRADSQLVEDLQEAVETISARLSGNEDYIQLLAQMRIRGELTPSNFEVRTGTYVEDHPELINFTWVDAGRYIQGVSPLDGNSQILGLHLDLPEPARVSLAAEESQSAQYTNTFEAIQGDCSFEIWFPVFQAQVFDGLFAGVYSCQRLLDSAIPQSTLDNYSVAITDESGTTLAERRGETESVGEPASASLDVGNNLQLAIARQQTGSLDGNLLVLSGISVLLALALIGGLQLLHREAKKRALIQAELENRNDELHQFTYRTSHDLRSPLVTIGRLAAYMKQDLEQADYDEVEESRVMIESSAAKLDKLVGDILNLTRADKTGNEVEEIDFESLFREIEERHADSAREKNIEIRTSIGEHMPIRIERIRLEQVLDNLVSNSVKYSRSGESASPRIELGVTGTPTKIQITVVDNGVGIPTEHQDEAFQMFKRFHPDAAAGSGLGLYLVKKHVDQMGGTVGLQSGKDGTSIQLNLPVKA